MPSSVPSITATVSPSTTRLTVPISDFELIITTESSEIDEVELNSILSEHLLRQMKDDLPQATEVTKVDVTLTGVSRRLKKGDEDNGQGKPGKKNEVTTVADSTNVTSEEGIVVDSVNATFEESSVKTLNEEEIVIDGPTAHVFTVSGEAHFAGSAVPSTEQLDEVNQSAFEGEAGNDFANDLLSAEDPGLQSTTGISVPVFDELEGEWEEGFLFVNPAPSPENSSANTALYVVVVMFVVGLLMVAVFVHRTRGRKRARDVDHDDVSAIEFFEL